jgi:hypothetical protein
MSRYDILKTGAHDSYCLHYTRMTPETIGLPPFFILDGIAKATDNMGHHAAKTHSLV